MSKLSFISHCVAYYAEHIGQNNTDIYELFKREGVIDFLVSDYDDLHGMGMEYLMQMIDDFLGRKRGIPKCNQTGSHALVRAILVPEIDRLISEKYKISEMEALDKFYTSSTGASFSDDETGLYGQSALHIFGLYLEEMGDKLEQEER